MALFILDFDETITSINTHNAVSCLINANFDDIWTIIKNIAPIGSPEIWRHTLRLIIQQGHKVAIASFNAYGSIVIPRYLLEVIGLTEEEVDIIHVESWLPLNPRNADKNEHIRCSIKDMEYHGAANTIVLIDDDINNITAAKRGGYTTIHAIDNYIELIQNLSEYLSNSSTDKETVFSFFKKHKSKSSDQPPSDLCCVVM